MRPNFYNKNSLSRNFSKPFVGIDIRNNSIKFAELVPGKQGLELGKIGEREIPEGIIESEDPKEALEKILKSMRKKEGIHYAKVSIPEDQIYTFEIRIPKVGKKEMYQAIGINLENLLEAPASDLVFDYAVMSEDEASHKVRVTVSSRAVIENYLEIFKTAGITVIGFELRAVALARSVIPKADTRMHMIVDCGEFETEISIVSDGAVLLSSAINKGMTAHNFSLLKNEINKDYIEWHSRKENAASGKKIEKIILSGSGARAAGLADYLSSNLKIKTELANVWGNINSFDNYIPPLAFKESLDYATVLGLALQEK